MKKSLKLISVLLLGLILVNAWILTLVKVHYELNKEYITQNYCINKATPQLHCEGSCHLKSTLTELTENSEQQSEAPTQNLNFISAEYYTSTFSFEIKEANHKKRASTSFEYNFYNKKHLTPIMHPPIV